MIAFIALPLLPAEERHRPLHEGVRRAYEETASSGGRRRDRCREV